MAIRSLATSLARMSAIAVLLCLSSFTLAQSEDQWVDISATFEIELSNPARNRRTGEATVTATVVNNGRETFAPLRLRMRDLVPSAIALREAEVADDGALVVGLGQGYGANETRQLQLTFTNADSEHIDFDPRIERFGDEPPYVTSITPIDGAVDVGLDTPIVVVFSEPLETASISADNFLLWSNGELIRPDVARQIGNRRVTLTTSLPTESVVAVVVLPGVRDRMGTPMTTWFISLFGTVGTMEDRPRIVAVSPDNAFTSAKTRPTASPPATIQLAADRALDPATLEGQVTVSVNGDPVSGRLELIANNEIIQFTPDSPLPPNVLVRFTVTSEVTDLAGNPLIPRTFLEPTPSGGSRVGTPPEPYVYDPDTQGPVNARNAIPQVLYNQYLDPATVNTVNAKLFVVEDSELEAQVESAVALVEDDLLGFTPAVPLEPGKRYRMFLSGAIADVDGEEQGSDQSLYFTLADDAVVDTRQPRVMRINPASGAENLSRNARFHVVFDEQISQVSFPWENVSSVGFTANSSEIVFKPSPLLLPSNSEISTDVPAVFDLAGNPLIPFSTRFTTGSLPVEVRTTVVASSPTGSRAPINTSASLLFSNPIDPISVNTLFLVDGVTGDRIESEVSQSTSGRRIHLVPLEPLKKGREYGVGGTVRDLANDSGLNIGQYSFQTGFDSDTTAPSLSMFNLSEGQIEVPNNVRLRARFDEPVDMVDLLEQNRVVLKDSQGTKVPFHLTLDPDRQGVQLTPVQLLDAYEDYELAVGSISDRSGNRSAQSWAVSFTSAATLDAQAISVTHRSPPSPPDSVPTNVVPQFRFSERVDPVSVAVEGAEINASNVEQEIAELRVSDDGRTLSIVPLSPLARAERFSFFLNRGVTDLAGNLADSGFSAFDTGLFTDETPPMLTLRTPPEGAIQVPVNSRIALNFDDQLSPVCLADAISLNDEPVVDLEIMDETTIEITPLQPLMPDSIYTLAVNGICNYAALKMPAFEFSFTTSSSSASDGAAPELVSVTPAHDSADIAADEPIVIVFSEAVDPLSLDKLRIETDGGPITGEFSVDGATVTFTPDGLAPQFSQIQIVNTGVADLAGNASAGFSSSYETLGRFDETAPFVEAVSPENGASDVPTSFTVQLRFSEPMDGRTLNTNNLFFWTEGRVLRPEISRSADNRSVELSQFVQDDALVVVVALPGLKDLSGNSLAPWFASSFDVKRVFGSGDLQIDRVFPAISPFGSKDFEEVVILFESALDESSLRDNVIVLENGESVQVERQLTSDGRGLALVPLLPFTPGATVQLFLEDGLRSVSGKTLSRALEYEFTKSLVEAERPGRPPVVTDVSPSPRSTGAPVNSRIEVRFTEPLNPDTVTTSRVRLTDQNGNTLSNTVALVGEGLVVRVTPDSLLQPAHSYEFSIFSVEDFEGNRSRSYQTTFTTRQSPTPDNERPFVIYASPPNGTTEVPLNAAISWRLNEPWNEALLDQELYPRLGLTPDKQSITYRPPGILWPENTTITVDVPPLEDLAGNRVLPETIAFTTSSSVNVDASRILDFSPGRNSSPDAVPLNAMLEIYLNSPLRAERLNTSRITLTENGSRDVVPSSIGISEDGLVVYVLPDSPLKPDTQYNVKTTILVSLGDSLIQDTGLSFTTSAVADEQPPSILSAAIRDGQSDVPPNLNIQMLFDERVNTAKIIANETIALFDSEGNQVGIDYSFDFFAPYELSISSAGLLEPLSEYTLRLSTIVDWSGNERVLNEDRRFTTAALPDGVAPIGLTSQPVDGQTGVPTDAVIELLMSEPVQLATVRSDGIRLLDEDGNQIERIAVTAELADNNTRIRFVPDEALPANSSFLVFFAGIEDLAGNGNFFSAPSVRFETGAGPAN